MFGEAAVLGVLSTVVVPVTVEVLVPVTVEDTVVLVSTADAREGINRKIRGKIYHDFTPLTPNILTLSFSLVVLPL